MAEENLGAVEKLARIQKALVSYEESKGLPSVTYNNEALTYLNINTKALKALSAEDCGVGATLLMQYSFQIQKAMNEEKSVINWTTSEIRSTIAGEVSQYSGGSAEERRTSAIMNNEYTRNLNRLGTQAQARFDRLEFLANRIEAVGKSLIELQQTKRALRA